MFSGCSSDKSRMHDGNFLKFGESFNYDMTLNSLDFGVRRGEVTTGPNMGQNSVLSHSSTQMYQVATFVNEKDYWGSVKHF